MFMYDELVYDYFTITIIKCNAHLIVFQQQYNNTFIKYIKSMRLSNKIAHDIIDGSMNIIMHDAVHALQYFRSKKYHSGNRLHILRLHYYDDFRPRKSS